MKLFRGQRASIALLLYSCVLFSSFACALGHGQSSGLWLSGFGELTCSAGDTGNPQSPAPSAASSGFSCPLCSSHVQAPPAPHGWALNLPQWRPSTPPLNLAHSLLPASSPWPTTEPRAPPAYS